MSTMQTDTGLEVRLYPNAIEFWDARTGQKVLALTPQEYGQITRWVRDEIEGVAAAWPFGVAFGS